MAALKYDWSDFLTDKERKDLKNFLPKGLPTPGKMLDWEKCEPIVYTPEEIRDLNSKSRD
jgi:hypothetical protein